jgi:hypothetical protein
LISTSHPPMRLAMSFNPPSKSKTQFNFFLFFFLP